MAASLLLCGPSLDSVLVASSSCFEGGDGGADASVPTLTRLLLTITLRPFVLLLPILGEDLDAFRLLEEDDFDDKPLRGRTRV